jgi:hypothetical protein
MGLRDRAGAHMPARPACGPDLRDRPASDLLVPDRDDVAALELPASSQLDPAADGDDALCEQRADVGARVDQSCELEQLAEPDAVVPDLDLAHRAMLPEPGR